MLTINVPNEQAMNAVGQQIAIATQGVGIIYLKGGLGAGKTTLSRAVLRGLGYTGNVKSPTYTLVEPYELGTHTVYHFDLYRLKDPEELELMGIRDYFTKPNLALIEWPERGLGWLPQPDLEIAIKAAQPVGRKLEVVGLSEYGHQLADFIKKNVYTI